MSHHPAKFGGYSDSVSGVIMILLCHVISQDQVIKLSCDLKNESLLW